MTLCWHLQYDWHARGSPSIDRNGSRALVSEDRFMSITSSARPGLRAHVDSTRLSFQDLVTRVTAIIGRKLTAYIARVDVRTVDRWVQGSNPSNPYGDANARLRFTYQVIVPLADHDKPAVVQAWLTGLNHELRDRTPVRLLREQDLEVVGPELLGAVRAFIAGG
jgi:hypothetical protein